MKKKAQRVEVQLFKMKRRFSTFKKTEIIKRKRKRPQTSVRKKGQDSFRDVANVLSITKLASMRTRPLITMSLSMTLMKELRLTTSKLLVGTRRAQTMKSRRRTLSLMLLRGTQ